MALDKVIDSAVLDAGLTSVADAIRARGGTSEQLAFPGGFVSAVEGIQAGGGTSEIVLPDTPGRVYIALAPSDYEERFYMFVSANGHGSGGSGTLEINIGDVKNGIFVSESVVDYTDAANSYNTRSITLPAHDKIKVLELKNADEDEGFTVTGCQFPNFNSPIILDMKINCKIPIRPGGTDGSHITRSVRKWTLNADADGNVQSYLGFQFAGCDELDLSRVTWPAMTTVHSMFLNSACRKIVIPNFMPEGSTANSLLQMFDGCVNVREIIGLDTWNLSSVNNIKWAFRWCQSLKELDLSSWGKYSSNFANIDGFNRYCTQLKTINLSGWNVGHLTKVYDVFHGCGSLENIIMDGTTWIASSFKLDDCSNLKVESLNFVIAALPTLAEGTTQTLTLGSTNMAKLTEDEVAVATGKGWTVA